MPRRTSYQQLQLEERMTIASLRQQGSSVRAMARTLDNSALGMLLMLKDKAATVGRTIQITNLKGMARQVLEIANFHKKFTIIS
jgi:hypothetical protein